MIKSVLNGYASAGTLSSFIAVLNVRTKCYTAQIVCFSTLKKVTVNL